MEDRWATVKSDLESGDSDRVGDAIESINEMAIEERLGLLEVCQSDLLELYEASTDGYVRQAVVRVVEALTPGLPTVMALEDGRLSDIDETGLRDRTADLCEFQLSALEDEDGRVRRAAKRGLKDIVRTYDALGDDDAIDAIVSKLDEMATEAAEPRAKHLREAKEEAEFFRQSGITRILESFQEELSDDLRGGE